MENLSGRPSRLRAMELPWRFGGALIVLAILALFIPSPARADVCGYGDYLPRFISAHASQTIVVGRIVAFTRPHPRVSLPARAAMSHVRVRVEHVYRGSAAAGDLVTFDLAPHECDTDPRLVRGDRTVFALSAGGDAGADGWWAWKIRPPDIERSGTIRDDTATEQDVAATLGPLPETSTGASSGVPLVRFGVLLLLVGLALSRRRRDRASARGSAVHRA